MWDSDALRDRRAMYNGNRFKLGLFGANCSSGRAITKVPERWSGEWSDNLELARVADDAGLDFLLPIGRWKGYGGETEYQGATWETITWATGLLAATKRITVFATVHAPLFHPVIAAKQFVTADHIGRGRFGINIVCGWNEGEFKMFGVDPREHEDRYAQGQEWIDVIQMMWQRDEEFDFDGKYIKLEQVRSDPKPYGGTRPIMMNAGASETGQAFAVRNCDALFCTPPGADSLDKLTAGIQHSKDLAAAQGRAIDVYSVGVITCRPTMKEAEDYHHHCIIDEADWGAIDNILAMKNITPDNTGAGLRGIGVSLVNYGEELPFFLDEVLPRLERLGLREPRP
jgi:alkanesulfonate monooxygenase SsuD/methylene tetrahydromethanopterin reductase-like flavin-dependent oxidoreductase (luciferase family)